MRRKRRMISDKRKRRFREESTLALVVAEKILAAVKMMRIRIRILTDRHARVERCIIRGW